MGALSLFDGVMGNATGRLAGRVKAVATVVVAVSLLGLLGGCNNVSKKQYDAAMQENSDLREKISQLEQSNREKDLQAAARTSPGTPEYVPDAPRGSSGKNSDSLATGADDPDFRRNSDGSATATLAGDVTFDSGSATLKSSAKKGLDRIASTIKTKYAGRSIRVAGYTDSAPIIKSSWASNDALSQARADSVRKYLVTKGISGNKIDAMGYGAAKPKNTPAASRRVEIVILK